MEVKALLNPYKVLRVSSLSSKAEIKTAYRELSKKYHPDNAVTGDSLKFQEITKAWKYIERNHKDTKGYGSHQTVWKHKTLFSLSKEVI